MTSRVLGRAALALLPLLLAPLPPASAGSAPDGPAVTGYVLEAASPRLVTRDAGALTTVGVAALLLHADGRDVTRPSADALRMLRTAHEQGLRAEPLLSNWSNRLDDFDPAAARRLLRHEARVRRVAARLASYATEQGWDGITVDLERLRPADGPGLVLLLRELQDRMPADRTVSVDVSASTSVRIYHARGYRIRELGRAADVVALMTYDQHGPGWSGPGPIGALPWQRRTLAALTTAVPVSKVDLGVAGYGYTWPAHGTGHTVTDRGARRLVRQDGARAGWKAGKGEWRAELSDGTVIWWSDRRSYDVRRSLAVQEGIHGVAVWRLGSADPLT